MNVIPSMLLLRIRIRIIFGNWIRIRIKVKIKMLQWLNMKPWTLAMEAWRLKTEPGGSVD